MKRLYLDYLAGSPSRIVSATVVINRKLTKKRFLAILELLGQPPQRHKEWSETYGFVIPDELEDPRNLWDYLRSQKIRFQLEVKFEIQP